MKSAEMALDDRFALLDFWFIPYMDRSAHPEEARTRYQAILVDRQLGWSQMNAVRLNGPPCVEGLKTAWALLSVWAEQTANGRLHPGEVSHIDELPGHEEGSALGCQTCDHFFAWIREGGFGVMPEPSDPLLFRLIKATTEDL